MKKAYYFEDGTMVVVKNYSKAELKRAEEKYGKCVKIENWA